MRGTSKGKFTPKHPEKYIGQRDPTYRSSWELSFMLFCDNNPSIENWASESIKIPYKDPISGRTTVYVPDFLIVYIDKNQKKHAEVVEIKPRNQTVKEAVGKNPNRQLEYIKNMAKWEAASAYCKRFGLKFRVINEQDIFQGTGKKR
jgi:hypothetical protein